MSEESEKKELIEGTGQVFSDLGFSDATMMRLKSRIATQIVRTLDRRKLSVRAASKEAGITAADLSRIRNADLDRFKLDRLVRVAKRLGCRVDLREDEVAEGDQPSVPA